MGWKLAVSVLLIGVLAAYMSGIFSSPPSPPEIGDGWWGRGERPTTKEDTSIRKFKINVTDEDMDDLKGGLGSSHTAAITKMITKTTHRELILLNCSAQNTHIHSFNQSRACIFNVLIFVLVFVLVIGACVTGPL